MGKKITLRNKIRNTKNTRNTRNVRKLTITNKTYSRKLRYRTRTRTRTRTQTFPQIRIHKGGVKPDGKETSRGEEDEVPIVSQEEDIDARINDLERQLEMIKNETSTPPIRMSKPASQYHIPAYIPKFDDLPLPDSSPEFESIDPVSKETLDKYESASYNTPVVDIDKLPPTSLQIVGYSKHPFIRLKQLPNMKDKKLPKLLQSQNLILDAHGGIGNILTDNQKILANHYLRVIEIGEYGGVITISSKEYYKELNDILRNPKYKELFDDTHKGKELREAAYTKLCKYISDSRKPRCNNPSINKIDKYFKLIHLTHDRLFSGDRDDKDVRESHIVTAETLTSLEHQGLFVPLPYNKEKTGLPYFKKELFRLYPGSSLLSKNTSISLVHNILPLAIQNNARFNIFVSSCNFSDRNFIVNPSIRDNSTGITKFLSKGKEFLFIVSSLSSMVYECLRKQFYRGVYQGKETAFNMNPLLRNSDTIDIELLDTVMNPLLCLKLMIFDSAYTPDISDNYNYETIVPYFLGPIVPDGSDINSNTENELVDELNNPEPFSNSPNPIQSELYAMAKLYLIHEFIDNIGTVLEISVSMLTRLNKLYWVVLEEIDTNPSNPLFTAKLIKFFTETHEPFIKLYHFLENVYDNLYSFYLPKLANDEQNKNPRFKAERFINKPFYVKFMKLYKSNSLFFDEHTNFMHESSSYENINPYRYKQRINIDELRDRMSGKGQFLSSSKSTRLSNAAKDKINISI
jgi:hypothetical protein